MNLNKAIIVGRMTRDPELRATTTGKTVASVGVATNRFYKDQQGQRQDITEFHNVVLWGRLAEIASQYLKKGQLVMFEGRLQTRTWEGQDGVKRSRTEIVAENMQLGPKAGESRSPASNPDSAPAPNEPKAEDLPTIQQDQPITDDTKAPVDVESIPF